MRTRITSNTDTFHAANISKSIKKSQLCKNKCKYLTSNIKVKKLKFRHCYNLLYFIACDNFKACYKIISERMLKNIAYRVTPSFVSKFCSLIKY